MVLMKGSIDLQRDFRVESYTYDRVLHGSWHAYKLAEGLLGDEQATESLTDCVRLWLPAGTAMNWASGTRNLRSNCIQFFWPQRWYMLSAFYNEDRLIHTYANIIRPANIQIDRLSYVELDLNALVKPDLTYEVLTQAEFDYLAETLHYDEETRVSALMALRTVTSAIQLSIGVYSIVPHYLNLTRLQVELS